ncbi:MAG: response regulator, partial [Methylococcaceae bacterium]
VLILSLFLGLNQVVENSRRQLQGLDLMTPVSTMIQLIQLHRDLSAGLLSGNSGMFKKLVSKEVKVSKNIKRIELDLPAHIITSNPWIKLKNNWNNIVDKGLNWSVGKSFSEHTHLINQLQFFKVFIADEYALTFTSEIDTSYLIDTSINKLPEAMEQLGQIRAFGTSILSKKQASEYQKFEMMALITKLETALFQLQINLDKTAHFNQVISPQLNIASSDISLSVQQVIKLVRFDILGNQFLNSPTAFFLQVTDAIDRNYKEMYQILLPTTKLLISTRLQHAENILYISISISLMLMMMVIYFVVGIYFSLKGSVQSLTHSLQLFANGDLQERINLNTQDELKQIGNSFNELAEKITYLLVKSENSQKKIQQILDGLLTMAGILLPDGTLDFANSTPLKRAGLTQADVLGKKLWDCHWFSYNSIIQDQIRSDCELAAQGEAVNREVEFALINTRIWVDFSVHPVFDDQGEIKFLVAEARDATRRRLAEEHSKRTQKMDALGKLVGGIAHDYNNMLGVILGYAELLEMKCTDHQGTENYISEIIRAGERGRTMTRKMLAFSKSESNKPDICNINNALLDFQDMLSKSLTASINLTYDLYNKAWPVWLDVNELEDAILNMSINAKFAMPEGGSLTIQTSNTYLAREEAKLLCLTANDYVKLCIIDTGVGMNEETKTHMFDPFFTTKGEAGNGLGLSQVFGFVERSGGAISVNTQLNSGTEFCLYFPRYHTDHHVRKTFDNKTAPQLTGDESILVVDDEPALRELANQILTHFGYRVLTASSGESALNILAAHPIDLMLSDVIMPNMDGFQLARNVSKLYPAVKIQLASGFSDNRHTDSEQQLRNTMLNKPYSSKELLTSIRLLLDGNKVTKDMP